LARKFQKNTNVYNPFKTSFYIKREPYSIGYLYKKAIIMNERSLKLLEIRPVIANARILPNMSEQEYFQNQTLRPILKLQNDLLLVSFQNYIVKAKNRFHELKKEARLNYIANAVQKDIKYRNSLKGMILGQFTLEEYEDYRKNSSALNKRMMSMAVKRLQDQMQYFEEATLLQ
jgi:hypothetical protein